MTQGARRILEERIPMAPQQVSDADMSLAMERKWDRYLEGLPKRTQRDQEVRSTLSKLYENEMRYVKKLHESTLAANVGPYQKQVFPVLRRAIPNLIMHDIASVQPLSAPVGVVFYYDLVYDTNKGRTTAGNIFPRDFDRNYSSELVEDELLASGNAVDYGGAGVVATISATTMYNPVRAYNTSLGYSVTITEFDAVGTVVQQAIDTPGTGGFTFVPAGANAGGSINYSNGAIISFKFQNVPALGNKIRVTYWYDNEASSKVAQNKFDIKLAEIRVRTRKLKTTFSAEAAEDAAALHAINLQAEMISQSSQELALEIDREGINEMLAASSSNADVFDTAIPPGREPLSHYRQAVTKLSGLSHQIAKRTLRAPGNWIVASSEVSSILEQLATNQDYRQIWVTGDPSPLNGAPMDMPRPLVQHGQFGVYKFGTLHNRWTLFVDPFMSRDFLLMGLKGQSMAEAGYIYCPYMPLQFTQAFEDPNDQTIRMGLRARYATKLIRPDYFAQLRFLNL